MIVFGGYGLSLGEIGILMNAYESDELLQQYLIFHYAAEHEQFPYGFGGSDGFAFPQRCVSEGVDFDALVKGARALDLGCSVGRSSFELARHCSQVIGVDYSHSFINAATRLKEYGIHPATRLDEGSSKTELTISVPAEIDRSIVSFEQGDAQQIRADIGQFDVVFACNLICRLGQPRRLLDRLPELVKPGGQLFITTPFTWLEAYTPSEQWLSHGVEDSFSGLRGALAPHFELSQHWDMPFLIREHARKFQYSIAQASRWTRC